MTTSRMVFLPTLEDRDRFEDEIKWLVDSYTMIPVEGWNPGNFKVEVELPISSLRDFFTACGKRGPTQI